MSTTIDYPALLRSAADHMERFPNLAANTAAFSVWNTGLRVQVYPVTGGTHLSVFAEWIPALSETQPITVNHHGDGKTVALRMTGKLGDGTPVDLACLPDEFELDLLAAQTPMGDGDSFPVELLLRLTDTRTCESPGDQEHDHAMCEDAVAEHTVTPAPPGWADLVPGALVEAVPSGNQSDGSPITRPVRLRLDSAPWGYEPTRGTYVISDGTSPVVVVASSVRVVVEVL